MSLPEPFYADDAVTIYHGDARALLPLVQADVMVTDPPYGMAYDSGWSSRPIDGDLTLWGDRPALVFGRWDCPHPDRAKLALVWDKGDWPGMGDLNLPWGPSTEEIYVLGEGFVGKRSGSVIRAKRLTGDTAHPNEKPVGLLCELVGKCPPGVIVDPFAGSGSTLRAAKNLGRQAVGIELDAHYCRVAAERMRQGALALDFGGAA